MMAQKNALPRFGTLDSSFKDGHIVDFALHLLGKVGIPVTDADRQLFRGCYTVEDIMYRLSESGTIDKLFLTGTAYGLGNLGEFYVALRCEAKWDTRPGFDVWGAFEYADMIEAGKIEVKTCGPGKRKGWRPRITGRKKQLIANVLVIIGMHDSFNPCKASLFVIPRNHLQNVVENWQNEMDPIPRITINKNRYRRAGPHRTDALNKYHEFYLLNHNRLKDVVAAYSTGNLIVKSEYYQPPLF